MTEDFIEGADYTLTIKGKLSENQAFGVYQNGYKNLVGIMEKNETTGLYSLTFKSLATQSGYERTLLVYNTPFSTKTSATIEWGQLEKGSVGSDYKQAPEDVEKDIDQRMGTDRWIVNKYEATTASIIQPSNLISLQPEDVPSIQHLRGKKEISSEIVLDLVDSTSYTGHASSLFHLYTYLYSSEPKTVAVTLSHTASASLYVNGTEAYGSSTSGTDVQVTLVLIQGWNSIDAILNNVTTAGTIKFDKNFKELADAMSCYFGGGMSASQIRQLSDEIDLKVQVGEIVAGINISNDIINGARIEITGDTNFTDDVTMDGGVIKSSTGTTENPIPYSEINLNAGTFSLGDGALTFDPINGLEVDGTISASNVQTGTMSGSNMTVDLDNGRQTYTDPLTGHKLVFEKGITQYQIGADIYYLSYGANGLTLQADPANTGNGRNAGYSLSGLKTYIDFNNTSGDPNDFDARIIFNEDDLPGALQIRSILGGIYLRAGSTIPVRVQDNYVSFVTGVNSTTLQSDGFLRSGHIAQNTTSATSNVHIRSDGIMFMIGSASKYKNDIQLLENEIEYSKRVLDLHPKSWIDKGEQERADVRGRYYGVIAEDVEALGLQEYTTKNKDGELESVQYDRLWTLLIPVVREQETEIIGLKKELTDLKNMLSEKGII